MKRCFFTLYILFVTIAVSGQKWTYSSGSSDFDGKYKTASIIGSGGEFPYTKPHFVINCFDDNSLNIYFSGVGYAGCDNKTAYFKFDKDNKTYKFDVTTNNNNDIWFIKSGFIPDMTLTFSDLFTKLKENSKLSVRLSSACNTNDYYFSLSGSTVAIDFVTKEYMKLKPE